MAKKVSGSIHGDVVAKDVRKQRKWFKYAKRAAAALFVVLAIGIVIRTFAGSVVLQVNLQDALNAKDPNIAVWNKTTAVTETTEGKKPVTTNILELGAASQTPSPTNQQGSFSYFAKFNPGIYEVCLAAKASTGVSGVFYVSSEYTETGSQGERWVDYFEKSATSYKDSNGIEINTSNYTNICTNFTVTNTSKDTKYKFTTFTNNNALRVSTLTVKTTSISTNDKLFEKTAAAGGNSTQTEGNGQSLSYTKGALTQDTIDGITQKTIDIAAGGSISSSASIRQGSNNYQACVYAKSLTESNKAAMSVNYIPYENKRLAKFSKTGAFVSSIGSYDLPSAETATPMHIASDKDNNVYVAGRYEGTHDFNPTTAVETHVSNGGADIFLTKYSSSGNYIWTRTIGNEYSDSPTGITTDTAGNVFVTGAFQKTVNFNPLGNDSKTAQSSQDMFYSKWSTDGQYDYTATTNRGYNFPNGIAVDTNNNVYLIDVGGVHKFSSTGTYQAGYGSYAIGAAPSLGKFGGLRGVVADTNGGIVVVDSGNIQKMTAGGVFSSLVAKIDSGPNGYGDDVRGVTTDAGGNIYLVQNNEARVIKYSPTGTFLGVTIANANTETGFTYPDGGIAIDKLGNIYATDNRSQSKYTEMPEVTSGPSTGYVKRCMPVTVSGSPFVQTTRVVDINFRSTGTGGWRVKAVTLELLETDLTAAYKYPMNYPQFVFGVGLKQVTDSSASGTNEALELSTGQTMQYSFTPTGSSNGIYTLCMSMRSLTPTTAYTFNEYGTQGGQGTTKQTSATFNTTSAYENRCVLADTKTNGTTRTVNFTPTAGTVRIRSITVQPTLPN